MSFVSISCSTPCGDSSWQPGSADGSLCLSVCGPLRRSHRHAQYGTQVLKDCSARRRTLLYPRGLQPERPLVHAMSVITGNLKQAAISHDATLARTPLHLASDQSDWLTKKRLLHSLGTVRTRFDIQATRASLTVWPSACHSHRQSRSPRPPNALIGHTTHTTPAPALLTATTWSLLSATAKRKLTR